MLCGDGDMDGDEWRRGWRRRRIVLKRSYLRMTYPIWMEKKCYYQTRVDGVGRVCAGWYHTG